MQFKLSTVALAALVAQACGHGLVTSIQGANGVVMPGLGTIDGTPRDCSTPGCGSENDTPVFKKKNGVLGSTKKGGAVSAAQGVTAFMGQGAAAAAAPPARRGLLDKLKAQQAQQNNNGNDATPTKSQQGATENINAQTAGKGAQQGLPQVGADGKINLNFHQVNGDGAGPYTAAVDPTSGGTSEAAFQPAQMNVNVPGRNSLDGQNKASDMQLQVQMPAGMKCTGNVAGQQGVCVVRIQNSALAGPFGGSAVFQQAPAGGAAPAAASASPSPAAGGAAGAAARVRRFLLERSEEQDLDEEEE